MTWFGQVSAWMALAGGVLFAALAAIRLSDGLILWPPMLVAALLLTGWYRTWRKMSGGLRVLAGAWGVTLGLALLAAPIDVIPYDPNLFTLAGAADLIPLLIAATGLALTVLHKESK